MPLTEQDIKTLPELRLRPNKYFKDVDYPHLHQKRMILVMLLKMGMVNGDDVGAGKTADCVIHFSYVLSALPNAKAIVFTEKLCLEQWRDEFKKLCPGIRTKTITAETHPNAAQRVAAIRHWEGEVLVTTYSTLYEYARYIVEWGGEKLVLYADEPKYKDTHSKMHGLMCYLAEHCYRKYGITATIIENRLEEAYANMHVVAPWIFKTEKFFTDNFCIRHTFKKPRFHTRTVGYKNLGLFRELIQPAFYGRPSTDPELEAVLPKLIEVEQPIVLGRQQSEKVLEAMDQILTLTDGSMQTLTVLTALIRAQQLVNDPTLLGFDIPSAKTEALIESLTGQLKGHKVIVHSKYRTQIDKLEASFKKAGIRLVRVTGAESQDVRISNKDKFQKDEKIQALLMTRAGLKGGNMQAANNIFWYDLPWNWGLYHHGVGRIRRDGSLHKKVASHWMLATLHPDVAAKMGGEGKTIDHYTLDVLRKKAKIVQAVTSTEETLDDPNSDMTQVYEEIRQGWRPSGVRQV